MIFVCIFLFSLAQIVSAVPDSSVSSYVSDIKMKFAPEYKKQTMANRLFMPQKPFTPFDNIVCEATSSINAAGHLTARLIVEESNKPINIIASSNAIGKGKLSLAGVIYSFEFSGWPGGWTSDNDVMDRLIETGRFKCEILYDGKIAAEKEEPITSCVHLWGYDGSGFVEYNKKADFRIVYMQGESTTENSQWIVNEGEKSRKEGFEKYSPFKEYNESFAHYADLKAFNDVDLITLGDQFFIPSVIANFESSCKGDYYAFYNNLTYAAYSSYALPIFFLNNEIIENSLQNKDYKWDSQFTFFHEFGHSFCGLSDEYISNSYLQMLLGDSPLFTESFNRNCGYRGRFPFLGSVFGVVLNEYKGCSLEDKYRSSADSIMNTGIEKNTQKHNLVSCAYCLKKIKNMWGIDLNECKNMDIVPLGFECSAGFIGAVQCILMGFNVDCANCVGNRCISLIGGKCFDKDKNKNGICNSEGQCIT